MKTTVDWLRFRAKNEPVRFLMRCVRCMETGLVIFICSPAKKGYWALGSPARLSCKDMPIGRMDFGGESQMGWVRVDIPGKGCEWVQDWCATDAVESLTSAQIRRLDIALTTWDGEVTHDRVLHAHSEGSSSRVVSLQRCAKS